MCPCMVFISFCLNAPISKRETEAQSRVTGKWVWGYGLCGSEAQRQSSGANCRGPGSSPDKSQMGTWGGQLTWGGHFSRVPPGGAWVPGPQCWFPAQPPPCALRHTSLTPFQDIKPPRKLQVSCSGGGGGRFPSQGDGCGEATPTPGLESCPPAPGPPLA